VEAADKEMAVSGHRHKSMDQRAPADNKQPDLLGHRLHSPTGSSDVTFCSQKKFEIESSNCRQGALLSKMASDLIIAAAVSQPSAE